MVYHSHVDPHHTLYHKGVIYHFLGVMYHISTFQMPGARASQLASEPPSHAGSAAGASESESDITGGPGGKH
jgi:hypothetical protein